MQIVIEFFAQRIDLPDTVAFQRARHLARRHFHALGYGFYNFALLARIFRDRIKGTRHIVRYREHVASKVCDAVAVGISDVFSGAAADIFGLGQRAQELIL